MGILSDAMRAKLPANEFAGPNRTYPVPDKLHAVNAKARATQALRAGRLSPKQVAAIREKADAVLGRSGPGAAAPVRAAGIKKG